MSGWRRHTMQHRIPYRFWERLGWLLNTRHAVVVFSFQVKSKETTMFDTMQLEVRSLKRAKR